MTLFATTPEADAVDVSQTRASTRIVFRIHDAGPMIDDEARCLVATFIPETAIVEIYSTGHAVMKAEGHRLCGRGAVGESALRTMSDEDGDLPDWVESLFAVLARLRTNPGASLPPATHRLTP